MNSLPSTSRAIQVPQQIQNLNSSTSSEEINHCISLVAQNCFQQSQRLTSMQKSLLAKDSSIQTITNQKNQFKETCLVLTKEKLELEQELAQANINLQKIDQLVELLSQKNEELNSCQKQIEELQRIKEILIHDCNELKQRFDCLNDNFCKLNQQYQSLESHLEEKTEEVVLLKLNVSQLAEKAKNLELSQNDLKVEKSLIENSLDSATNQVSELNQRLDQANAEVIQQSFVNEVKSKRWDTFYKCIGVQGALSFISPLFLMSAAVIIIEKYQITKDFCDHIDKYFEEFKNIVRAEQPHLSQVELVEETIKRCRNHVFQVPAKVS